jgi:phosphatidylserine/phosphatidylglycerophosphate/cardiolipin synthase-like enzyme
MNRRFIHSRAASRQIPDLLQTIFAGELLAPSRCIWLVSPWISDIPLIDNRGNTFLSLVPQWPRTTVRLSQILVHLLEQGTTIHIALEDETHNTSFLENLRAGTGGRTLPLRLHITPDLHEKGILGDTFYLSGSMNLTYNGITSNEEMIHYITDPQDIAANRLVFRERWGGELPV